MHPMHRKEEPDHPGWRRTGRRSLGSSDRTETRSRLPAVFRRVKRAGVQAREFRAYH